MIYKFQSLARRFYPPSRLWNSFRFALRRPGRAWKHFTRTGSEAWIKENFATVSECRALIGEVESSELVRVIDGQLAERFATMQGRTARGNPYTPGTMIRQQAFNIYALIRKLQPEVLVETGVCNGFSTAIFLAALNRNNRGHLYSIDFPELAGDPTSAAGHWEKKGGAVVPAGEVSGWLVPAELRNRWTLILGKSQEKLPLLLAELKAIDLFVHDSEHSLENQLFEFRLAFQHLRSGGLLLASDITWSAAFDRFWPEVSLRAHRQFMDHNLALVIKQNPTGG